MKTTEEEDLEKDLDWCTAYAERILAKRPTGQLALVALSLKNDVRVVRRSLENGEPIAAVTAALRIGQLVQKLELLEWVPKLRDRNLTPGLMVTVASLGIGKGLGLIKAQGEHSKSASDKRNLKDTELMEAAESDLKLYPPSKVAKMIHGDARYRAGPKHKKKNKFGSERTIRRNLTRIQTASIAKKKSGQH